MYADPNLRVANEHLHREMEKLLAENRKLRAALALRARHEVADSVELHGSVDAAGSAVRPARVPAQPRRANP